MCDLILNGKAEMVVGDRLSSTYFTENKRNDIWTLWPDSGYFANNTKYSVVLGMGPAWK